MVDIERRIEARHREPQYQEWTFDANERAEQKHRSAVGGKWSEMGRVQLDFLKEQGLAPSMRFLDVGCGSFRAGRLLVPYLDPGHYYGIDIAAEIIEAGYEDELDDEARARLPVSNLRMTDRFDCDFGVDFDMAIAQSLFTHISLNHIRLCLHRVAKVMRPGGDVLRHLQREAPRLPDRRHVGSGVHRAQRLLVLPARPALGRGAGPARVPLHR